jgi:tRNA (cytidine/uridine-2'-O-)-methyltransferase
MSDKNLRRPGLDYWPFLDLEIHDRFAELDARFSGNVAFLSKKADKLYTEIPADVNLLVFGRETSGLPEEWMQTRAHQFYRIPIMHEGVRSLNLSNAASIVLYDQLGRRNLL